MMETIGGGGGEDVREAELPGRRSRLGARAVVADQRVINLAGHKVLEATDDVVRRFIKIELTRPGLQAPIYRSEYTLPRVRTSR